MQHLSRSAVQILLLLTITYPLAQSQDTTQDTRTSTADKQESSEPPVIASKNEFGIWTGYSPRSFHLKGTSEHRQLFLLNLQYARKLLITRPVTFKYTAEIVPVAVEFQPRQAYLLGNRPIVNPPGAVYGVGASPIGFQGNFGRRKIQPFANGSLGFLYFNQQVPLIESSQFNYTITIGGGAQFFHRSGRSFTLGWKYHHLSNNYQAALNPGIDSTIFYAGFSVPTLFHRKQ